MRVENAKVVQVVREKKVVHPTETATMVKKVKKTKKTGRPKRNKVIDQEDIDNLKIALYTTKSVDEFIKVMW